MTRTFRRASIAALAAGALLAGCGDDGGGSGDGGGGDRAVTLTLQGGEANENLTACEKTDAFELYPKGAEVRYSGTVTPAPSGRWKAKVKIKRCQGNEFVETDSQKIVGQPNGEFEGVYRDLEPGHYFMRARYQGEKRPESPKIFFKVE